MYLVGSHMISTTIMCCTIACAQPCVSTGKKIFICSVQTQYCIFHKSRAVVYIYKKSCGLNSLVISANVSISD